MKHIMMQTFFLLTLLLVAGQSFGKKDADIGSGANGPARQAQPEALAKQITEKFGIRRFESVELILPEDIPDEFTVEIELDGELKQLYLYRNSVRGLNFGVFVQQAGGSFINFDLYLPQALLLLFLVYLALIYLFCLIMS